MGIFDDPIYGLKAKTLLPTRDLPNVIAHWRADDLADLVDGASAPKLEDHSGLGWNLATAAGYVAPTKRTHANGLSILRFAAGQKLAAPMMGQAGGWPDNTLYPQPLSSFWVVKPSSANTGTVRLFKGLGTLAGMEFQLDTTRHTPLVAAPTGLPMDSPDVLDDAWHVFAFMTWDQGWAVFMDGYLVGSATTTSIGTQGLAAITIPGSTSECLMDFAEAIVCNSGLTFSQIEGVSAALAEKWDAATGGRCAVNVQYEATTSANGQSVRIWSPPTSLLATPRTLVLHCHQSSGSEQITPSYYLYPLVHAAMQNGWYVASSFMHGNSWGSDQAMLDMLDIYNLVNARDPISKVVLLAPSMGGSAAARMVADGRLAGIKGAYVLSGAIPLRYVYNDGTALHNGDINTAWSVSTGTLAASALVAATSVSSSVSFANGTILAIGANTANYEIVSVNGVPSGVGPYTLPVTALTHAHNSAEQISDMPSKTAGKDPGVLAAGAFPSIRWRFIAGAGDTLISKTQSTDVFRATIATDAVESGLLTNFGNHLEGATISPADFVAFVARCAGDA